MGTFHSNTRTPYRAHAALLVAELPVARAGTRGRSDVRAATAGDPGLWSVIGIVVGVVLIAAGCAFALTRHGQDVPSGGLLSAVPSDAAFGATVRDALRTMGTYESASDAADLPDPEGWAAEFVENAVMPAQAELAAATPPVHLRGPTEAAVAALGRVKLERDGYEACRSMGASCFTQRRAFDRAIDDAYRILGDLALYTFG